MSPAQRALLGAIRVYQLTASAVLGRQCRYLPSCSDYAAEAVRRHGAWPGVWMAGARLCRCHPLGGWGYDPVPIRCEAVPASQPWRHGVWRTRPVTELAAEPAPRDPPARSARRIGRSPDARARARAR